MDILEIIRKRRDGEGNSQEELAALSLGASSGEWPDYQLAAWLMAAFLQPLNPQETAWLTMAMADSGERLDLTGLPKPWVDKHSTGGVGDKTTLVALPILAACGLSVVKMSGRGLGITGGTIDKLASVPGFRTDLNPKEMVLQAREIGVALSGQTPSLAPADKALYALRDVTATVDSIPLIVSSILSKKIAGSADTILIDVKCGSGAFMKSEAAARRLAKSLTDTGSRCGIKVNALLTDMDEPLGSSVGNAVEVVEALRVLSGAVKGRFNDLCIQLCAEALFLSGKSLSQEEAEARVEAAVSSGRALAKAEEWFAAQGGDVRVVHAPARLLEPGLCERTVRHSGDRAWVARFSAESVGEAVLDLGGGRKKKSDAIDEQVGLISAIEVGTMVEDGQPLFTIRARSAGAAELAEGHVKSGLEFSSSPVSARSVVL